MCIRDSGTTLLQTYDDMDIDITLAFKDTVTDFIVGFTIFDGQLRESLSSAATSSFINAGAGQKTYTVKIPSIILATGKYTLTLVVAEPVTQKFYCRQTNAISFNVKSIGNTWATSDVPSEWIEI